MFLLVLVFLVFCSVFSALGVFVMEMVNGMGRGGWDECGREGLK
jgi:hypothetical protein